MQKFLLATISGPLNAHTQEREGGSKVMARLLVQPILLFTNLLTKNNVRKTRRYQEGRKRIRVR